MNSNKLIENRTRGGFRNGNHTFVLTISRRSLLVYESHLYGHLLTEVHFSPSYQSYDTETWSFHIVKANARLASLSDSIHRGTHTYISIYSLVNPCLYRDNTGFFSIRIEIYKAFVSLSTHFQPAAYNHYPYN